MALGTGRICMYIYYVKYYKKSETSAKVKIAKIQKQSKGGKQATIKALQCFSYQ